MQKSETMDKYTRPDFSRCAVLTIDMQNDFVLPDAPAAVPGTWNVVPAVQRLLADCRLRGIPIVHVIRLYLADGSNVDLCRRSRIRHHPDVVIPGTNGAALVAPLMPEGAVPVDAAALVGGNIQQLAANEWILYKPRWGAFFQTKLEAWLKDNGINTLIFTGCNFPNCPRTSLYEASERDFKVAVVSDALSGIYDKGLEEIRQIGGAVYTTAELRDLLSVGEKKPKGFDPKR